MTFPIEGTPGLTIHPWQLPQPPPFSWDQALTLVIPSCPLTPPTLTFLWGGNFLRNNVWALLPGAALVLLAPNENVTVFNPPQP